MCFFPSQNFQVLKVENGQNFVSKVKIYPNFGFQKLKF